MKFPQLNPVRGGQTDITMFRGLNRTDNTAFSRINGRSASMFVEFKDMVNMSGDEFPQLSTRRPRSRILLNSPAKSDLLINDGRMIYIFDKASDRGSWRIGDQTVEIATPFGSPDAISRLCSYGNRAVEYASHSFVTLDGNNSTKDMNRTDSMQAGYPGDSQSKSSYSVWQNLIDFPDELAPNDSDPNGRYISHADSNTYYRRFFIEKVALDEGGVPLKAHFKVDAAINFEDESNQTKIRADGGDGVDNFQYGSLMRGIKPGETVEALFNSPSVLYKCTGIEAAGETGYNDNKIRRFVRIDKPYVRIWIKNSFVKGDFVKISGLTAAKGFCKTNGDALAEFNNHVYADELDYIYANTSYMDVLNGNYFKVYYADSNSIVIKADIDVSIPYAGPITASRVMPYTDAGLMLEVDNRLWSCSSPKNEIYACKQGDCTNWQAYGDGIATDSFAATVGCEGAFTGIARQNDCAIFFKENWILKVFGNKPSNFAIMSYNMPGVEKGSDRSVVWINGVLFYLSAKGVCQYAPGSVPVIISQAAFGDVKYKNGVAGRHRDKYYLSAQNPQGKYELFVYDTLTGIWHKEDGTQMLSAATYNNTLYWVDAETGNIVCAQDRDNLLETDAAFEQEGLFEWKCETGDLYESMFEAKHIHRLHIGLRSEENTQVRVLVQFESKGEWRELRVLRFDKPAPREIPIPVRRSDYLRVRLEGVGQCRVYGLKIEYYLGSVKR